MVGQGPQQHGVEKRQFDRLHQKLFGTVVNGAKGDIRGPMTDQRNDRNAGWFALDMLQELKSISIRKAKIEDGCVRAKLLKLPVRVLRGGGFGN